MIKPKPRLWRDLLTISFFIALLFCCFKNVSAWKAREAARKQHAKVAAEHQSFLAQRDELKVLDAEYEQSAEERREMMSKLRKLVTVCKKLEDFFPVFDDLVTVTQSYLRTDGFDVRVVVPNQDKHILRMLLQHVAVPNSKVVFDFDEHVVEVLLDKQVRLDSKVSLVTINKVLASAKVERLDEGEGTTQKFPEGLTVMLNGKLLAQLPFQDISKFTGSFDSGGGREIAVRPNQPRQFKFSDNWVYRGGLLGRMADGDEHRIILTCWLDPDQAPSVAADDLSAVRDILAASKMSDSTALWCDSKRYEYRGNGIYSVRQVGTDRQTRGAEN